MTSLIRKVTDLLPGLEKRGVVYLFAFVEREDVDRWDVIFSSEWSDRGMAMATFEISKELLSQLEPHEMAMLSRVVVIPSEEVFSSLKLDGDFEDVSPNDRKIVYGNFLGLAVKRALIFRSRQHLSTNNAVHHPVAA